MVAALYNNIGNVYDNQSDKNRALEYYKKALAYNLKTGKKSWQGINYNNIGLLLESQGKFSEALDYLQKAGKISPVLDIALAADIIHVLHSENFENFCMAESLPVEGALALARAQLELVFQAWAAEPSAHGMRKERKETKGAAPGRR